MPFSEVLFLNIFIKSIHFYERYMLKQEALQMQRNHVTHFVSRNNKHDLVFVTFYRPQSISY